MPSGCNFSFLMQSELTLQLVQDVWDNFKGAFDWTNSRTGTRGSMQELALVVLVVPAQ